MRISVAIAAYNGEKYISKQLMSILNQLSNEDEVIISVDPSNDNTLEAINSVADARVKVIAGAGRGLIANFENAINNCRGDIIFLSDQDDIWESSKVSTVVKVFREPDVLVVCHDAMICDESCERVIEKSFFSLRNSRNGLFKNFFRNSYMGSSMAFRRQLLEWAAPFPEYIPMHDQWLGLVAEKHGKTVFIPDKLLRYRRHSDNVTELHHAGIITMIGWRFNLLKSLVKR